MCGIVGYVGPGSSLEVLVGGLKRLEYRGYDSAGVAVLSAHAGLRSAALNVYVNAKGLDDRAFAEARLSELETLLGSAGPLNESVYEVVKAKVN